MKALALQPLAYGQLPTFDVFALRAHRQLDPDGEPHASRPFTFAWRLDDVRDVYGVLDAAAEPMHGMHGSPRWGRGEYDAALKVIRMTLPNASHVYELMRRLHSIAMARDGRAPEFKLHAAEMLLTVLDHFGYAWVDDVL